MPEWACQRDTGVSGAPGQLTILPITLIACSFPRSARDAASSSASVDAKIAALPGGATTYLRYLKSRRRNACEQKENCTFRPIPQVYAPNRCDCWQGMQAMDEERFLMVTQQISMSERKLGTRALRTAVGRPTGGV